MNVPRVVIAGAHSGVGKTTVSVGLMSALSQRGLKVQAFKVGPDYIDPSYHTIATGRPSRNLDTWMMRNAVIEIFERAARNVDIAIVEGVMGLYDSVSGLDETGSTAQIAKILRCPVILVLDVHDMARTAGALALGCRDFDEDVHIAGIILNKVANPTHAKSCEEAIETVSKIPVIGALPIENELTMPERHLGLIPTHEQAIPNTFLPKIRNLVQANVDLDRVIKIAESGEKMPEILHTVYPKRVYAKRVTIGVAFDEAFNFYYQDNLDLLQAYGADLKFLSPIRDKGIPRDVDGLYIGGGFPEMLPERLEANESMRRSLRKVAEDDMPIYAECGGLMYLTNSITDFNGNTFRMVGLLDGNTNMTKSLSMNYTLAEVVFDNPLLKTKDLVRGHEFHFSRITDVPNDAKFAYHLRFGKGIDGKRDAWMEHNTIASYMHLHFAQGRRMVRNFIESCEKYKHR